MQLDIYEGIIKTKIVGKLLKTPSKLVQAHILPATTTFATLHSLRVFLKILFLLSFSIAFFCNSSCIYQKIVNDESLFSMAFSASFAVK